MFSLERITKKEVLRILQHGRRSFRELMRMVRHPNERHGKRMEATLDTLRRNHYLVTEVVQTGEYEDKETGVKTPIMTTFFWCKQLYQKCKVA
jgi:hypothetical protein